MRIALQQYHIVESPSGSNNVKYNTAYYGHAVHGGNYSWCAVFPWWCGWIAAGKDDSLNPFYKSNNAADIQDLTVKYKGGKYILKHTSNNEKKKEALPKAKFGDSISMNFNGGSSREHTGLIVGRWGNDYYCLEGNTSFDDKGSQSNGGAVALRKRSYKVGVCIVRPDFKPFNFFVPSTTYIGEVPKLPERGYFQWGDSNKEVGKLQRALTWVNGYKVSQDNDLGSLTFAEIVIFQVAHNLEPDGKFGTECLKKLKQIIDSHKSPTTPPTSPQNGDLSDKKPQVNNNPNTTVKFAQKQYVPTQGDKCYDLSAHQGNLSVEYFNSIKKKGVNCVILRSSWSRMANGKMYQDDCFDNNIKNAIKAGMHIGIYHFSASVNSTESATEAKFCLKKIDPYKEHIDLPVGYDCEFGTKTNYGDPRFTSKVAKKLGRTGMGKMVDGFCKVIKDAGFEPMLYANLSMFLNYMPTDIHTKYKIWVAQYNSKCEYSHAYYMWQFTSNNGKLDENVFGTQGTNKKPVEKPTSLPALPARGWFQKGDTGENVKKMQKILIYLGFSCGKSGADGEYGDNTDSAVCKYEKKYGLTVDHAWGKLCNKKASDLLGLPIPEPTKAQKICDVAKECAYPIGTKKSTYQYPDGKPREAYKKDLDKAYPDRSKWGKQTRAGASCDVFVGTVLRCTVDGKFPRGLDEVELYMKTERGEKLWKTVSKAEPGDIIYQLYKGGGGHILINLGDGKIANAHHEGKTYPIIEEYSKSVKPTSSCKKIIIYRIK